MKMLITLKFPERTITKLQSQWSKCHWISHIIHQIHLFNQIHVLWGRARPESLFLRLLLSITHIRDQDDHQGASSSLFLCKIRSSFFPFSPFNVMTLCGIFGTRWWLIRIKSHSLRIIIQEQSPSNGTQEDDQGTKEKKKKIPKRSFHFRSSLCLFLLPGQLNCTICQSSSSSYNCVMFTFS